MARDALTDSLADAVAEALPVALASSVEEVERVVEAVDQDEPPRVAAEGLNVIAAAFGSKAATKVVRGILRWFADQEGHVYSWLPRWFQPALRADSVPAVITLTEFSNGRNRYVRDVIDSQSAVVISRHGKVVAAVVPLVAGAFESAVYVAAARDVRASRLRDRDEAIVMLDNLTEEEVEALSNATDRADAAASIGLDPSIVEVFDDWLSERTGSR